MQLTINYQLQNQQFNTQLISKQLKSQICNMYLMGFKKYLSKLQKFQKQGDSTRYVLGNSGADYDSVIGSLVYAFYLTTSFKVLHLPLIDCKQEDLALRFQITSVLQKFQIKQEELLYTQNIPNLFTSNNTFALYDHNFRDNIDIQKISQIIDHHAYNPSSVKCNHIINHCGSAMTLLYYLYYPKGLNNFKGSTLQQKFETYFKHNNINATGQSIFDKQSWELIKQLLYNGILIDTFALSPQQSQVWSQFDKRALQLIKQEIQPAFTYEELTSLKFDEERNLKLTFAQQQKKDYKQITYQKFSIHYSTILLNITKFLGRYENQLNMLNFDNMKENEVYAFMFSFPRDGKQDISSGRFAKYIMFGCKTEPVNGMLQEMLNEMKFTKHENRGRWRVWEDESGKISRKIFDKQVKSRL